jgi:uncharacterized damage-inducible protein DinB
LDEIGFLAATPDVLRALTGYLDDDAWRWKPAADSWSCLEVVAHLRDIEREHYGRWVLRVLGEARPVLAGRFDADGLARARRYNELDPEETLGAFAAARAETVAALRQAAAAWERPWVDGDGNEAPLRVLLRRFANHDAIHLGQIARVKRAQRAY